MRTTDQALTELGRARIPAGPIYAPQQALDDPHVQAARILGPFEYPGVAAAAALIRTPIELSVTPPRVRGRAPQLGEHTDQILTELGYAPDQIAALRAGHVV